MADPPVLLGLQVGNTWGGYSIRVLPEQYGVLEHETCREAKEPDAYDRSPSGLCVFRLSKQQSELFEAAMKPFERYALPLSVDTVASSQTPDGKPCQSRITDQDQIALIWVGSKGARIAGFDTGCDRDKHAKFYQSLYRISDTLPIKELLPER